MAVGKKPKDDHPWRNDGFYLAGKNLDHVLGCNDNNLFDYLAEELNDYRVGALTVKGGGIIDQVKKQHRLELETGD